MLLWLGVVKSLSIFLSVWRILNECASLGDIGGIIRCLKSRDEDEGTAKPCCSLGCNNEGITVVVDYLLFVSFPPKSKCGFYLIRDSLWIVSMRKLRFSWKISL